MVMNLPMPGYDNLQLIREVILQRAGGNNADFFNTIQAEWLQRVQHYIVSQASPAVVTQWPSITSKKKIFLNLYLSPARKSVQGPIFKNMRHKHDLSVCPACGELGTPTTLDHFLPKGLYPHLCISPANLLPMCSICQNIKGEKIGDVTSPRFFIHPYFDVFAAQQILRLEIFPPFDIPTFRLDASSNLTPAEMQQTRSHMRELNLEERYQTFFRREYRRLLRLVGKMRDSGQDVTKTLETFKFNESDQSLNTWPHVFYAAVIDNADLMTYLTMETLPPYL
jgi:5-methylcytosine-specific restriction endonuclease McrA